MSIRGALHSRNTQNTTKNLHFVRPCTVATAKTSSRTTCLCCTYYIHYTEHTRCQSVRPCTVETVKTLSKTSFRLAQHSRNSKNGLSDNMSVLHILCTQNTQDINSCGPAQSKQSKHYKKNVISLSPAQSQQQKRLLGQHVCIVYIIYTEHTRCQYVGPRTFEIAKH